MDCNPQKKFQAKSLLSILMRILLCRDVLRRFSCLRLLPGSLCFSSFWETGSETAIMSLDCVCGNYVKAWLWVWRDGSIEEKSSDPSTHTASWASHNVLQLQCQEIQCLLMCTWAPHVHTAFKKILLKQDWFDVWCIFTVRVKLNPSTLDQFHFPAVIPINMDS